jgi:predicted kinase
VPHDGGVATVHLIHGYLGVGKSRFARDLSSRSGAVLISLDEWYLRLYTNGAPTPHQEYELLDRLTGVLHGHWPQLLRAGVDLVLDFGFWRRSERDMTRELARSVSANHRLYWVRTDDETALSRCLIRNDHPGSAFIIDAAAYRDLKARFEELGGDEQFEVIET